MKDGKFGETPDRRCRKCNQELGKDEHRGAFGYSFLCGECFEEIRPA